MPKDRLPEVPEGPWEVHEDQGLVTIRDRDGRSLVLVYAVPERPALTALLAAAPELLREYGWLLDLAQQEYEGTSQEQYCIRARAAYDKARGLTSAGPGPPPASPPP